MLHTPVVPQLGILDPDKPSPSATIRRDFTNPVSDDREVIFTRDDYVCILSRSLTSKRRDGSPLQNQIELPREACLWISDSIEFKFWKPPEGGGLPDDVFHVDRVFRGELILLRRTMNCGDQGVKGFNLYNFNRCSYICSDIEQSAQLQDVLLLEFGLLTLFRELGSAAA